MEEHEAQAENTLRRRCGRARQFFKAAIKAKLIDENPFEGMSVTVTGSTDKARFITEEESQKILKACPDAEWRLIFSLCRYGGMRCPSEILPLTWNDILWDASRVIVTSPKTKRYKGQESRVIPLFPELRKALDEAYELAFLRLNDQPGDSDPVATVSGPVVTRYSSASQNLRTTFNKIVKRAGLKPWPKPFQNLRATRETELMEIYPAHVVVSWIGHSEKVARQHYLQTTDAHFEKAVQPTPSDLVGHMVGHNMCETTQNGEPRNKASHVKPSVLRGSSGDFATTSYPVGTRSIPENAGEMPRSESAGAQAGAIETDSDSQGQLKAQALEDLQRAWKAIRRMETLSDDRAEAKAAERALSLVDKAFAELERGTK